MSIYYIDYENVHEKGLKGLDGLSGKDTVCLLYSETAQSLTIDTMAGLTASGVNILYFKCMNTGKNYLDFQLSTVCGLMAGRKEDTDFVIVSEDKGFASLVDFWNGQTYFGKRYTCRQQKAILVAKEGEAKKKAGAKAEGNTSKKQKEAGKAETTGKTENDGKTVNAGKQEKKQETGKSKSGKRGSSKQEKKQQGPKTQDTKTQDPGKGAPGKPEQKKEEPVKQPQPQKKKGGLLQQKGITSISEGVRKKIRSAVKNLELKPTDYTLIYNIMLKATADSDMKNRLMQGLGKEKGEQTYRQIQEVYRSLLL